MKFSNIIKTKLHFNLKKIVKFLWKKIFNEFMFGSLNFHFWNLKRKSPHDVVNFECNLHTNKVISSRNFLANSSEMLTNRERNLLFLNGMNGRDEEKKYCTV